MSLMSTPAIPIQSHREQVQCLNADNRAELIEPQPMRQRRATTLEQEGRPIVRGVPRDDGREHDQADRRRKVRPRLDNDGPRARRRCAGSPRPRGERGVVLAQDRTAPGHADAQPGHKSVRIVQGDGQSVESGGAEKKSSGPSGWAMVATAIPSSREAWRAGPREPRPSGRRTAQ